MRGSRWPNDLALVAATAMATVAIFRQLTGRGQHQTNVRRGPADDAGPVPDLDHGRLARAPWEIPLAGWKDILYRTYQQINDDRLLATAAGVVFYGLLAIFPAITALVSSYGLFADPSTIADNLRSLALMLPEGSFSIVQDQVGRVLARGNVTLGWTFIIGLSIALWSANAGMKAILDALNVVYDEDEKRSFIKLNLISLSFTVAALARDSDHGERCRCGPVAVAKLGTWRACRTDRFSRKMANPRATAFVRAGDALSIRSKPCDCAMAVAECGRHSGRSAVGRRFNHTVLVSFKF